MSLLDARSREEARDSLLAVANDLDSYFKIGRFASRKKLSNGYVLRISINEGKPSKHGGKRI